MKGSHDDGGRGGGGGGRGATGTKKPARRAANEAPSCGARFNPRTSRSVISACETQCIKFA